MGQTSSDGQEKAGAYGKYPTAFDDVGLLGYDQEEVEKLALVDEDDRIENLATELVEQHPDLNWTETIKTLGALAQLDRARMEVVDELALIDLISRTIHASDLIVGQDL